MIMFSIFFFFKQKTAYEMRISDWSSDVCSSDLGGEAHSIGVTLGSSSIEAIGDLPDVEAAMGSPSMTRPRPVWPRRPLEVTRLTAAVGAAGGGSGRRGHSVRRQNQLAPPESTLQMKVIGS